MLNEKITKAASYIENKTSYRPKTAIILGSGLGDYAETLPEHVTIDYGNIPEFPVSTIAGHKGRFVINKDVLCMQGRFHYYEGYSMQDVTMPIRVMKRLGIENLIITNAAGGVDLNFSEGCLMLITDHINMMGNNPLIGANADEFGPRFPDMSEAYNKNLQSLAISCAKSLGISLHQGVYLAVTGPNYETPAEVKAFRTLGASAVGMSTVPESIVANHSGLKVLGISCITNMAAGFLDKPLRHDEVMETSAKVRSSFIDLVTEIVKNIK